LGRGGCRYATGSAGTLRELLCCLPQVLVPDAITYENIFRIIIMQFIDAHSFDVRSVKKTCVHIVHPDGRLIPFDTYNLFYRDNLEQIRLDPLSKESGSGPSSRGMNIHGVTAASAVPPERALGEVERANPQVNTESAAIGDKPQGQKKRGTPSFPARSKDRSKR
jgi:hypothetical protein